MSIFLLEKIKINLRCHSVWLGVHYKSWLNNLNSKDWVKRGGSAIACSTQSPGYMSMHLQRRTLKHTDPDSLNQLFRFASCVRLYFSGTVNLLVKTTRKEKIVNNACSIIFRMKLDRIWFFFCLTEFRSCAFFHTDSYFYSDCSIYIILTKDSINKVQHTTHKALHQHLTTERER